MVTNKLNFNNINIKNLPKPKMTTGLDGVPAFLIKDCIHIFLSTDDFI